MQNRRRVSLRQLYSEALTEPVPDAIHDLLAELDRKTARGTGK